MANRVRWYQKIIGSLQWEIEIGRIDILLEVTVMSNNMALPREGHIGQFLNIMGYMKNHKKMRLMFDYSNPIHVLKSTIGLTSIRMMRRRIPLTCLKQGDMPLPCNV